MGGKGDSGKGVGSKGEGSKGGGSKGGGEKGGKDGGKAARVLEAAWSKGGSGGKSDGKKGGGAGKGDDAGDPGWGSKGKGSKGKKGLPEPGEGKGGKDSGKDSKGKGHAAKGKGKGDSYGSKGKDASKGKEGRPSSSSTAEGVSAVPQPSLIAGIVMEDEEYDDDEEYYAEHDVGQAEQGMEEDPGGEMVEGVDWIFEDVLREMLDAKKSSEDAEETLRQEQRQEQEEVYLSIPAEEVALTFREALDSRYGKLVGRMQERVQDYAWRCDFAKEERARWEKDRLHLEELAVNSRAKAEDERQKAQQAATERANHAPRERGGVIQLAGGGMASGAGRVSHHKAKMQGVDIDLHVLEQEVDQIDVRTKHSRIQRTVAWLKAMWMWMLPLVKDVQYVKGHYGSASAILFTLYWWLLVIVSLDCLLYLPLLVMHLPTEMGSCGLTIPYPCAWMYGGMFESDGGDLAEDWAIFAEVLVSADGTLSLTNSSNQEGQLSQAEFEAKFAACPMVRYVRDCQHTAVFAGFTNSTVSAWDAFTTSWSKVSGTLNQDFVIFPSFKNLLWGQDRWNYCDLNAPGVGFPGQCGQSESTSAEWFALPTVTAMSGISTSATLEVFTGTHCLSSTKAAIEVLADGKLLLDWKSGRDLWLAARYVLAVVLTCISRLIIVLHLWQASEANLKQDMITEEMSPIHWSKLVLTVLDFRLVSDRDRDMNFQRIATSLRATYHEEQASQQDKIFNPRLQLKRCGTIILNLAIIVACWIAIWYVQAADLRASLSAGTSSAGLGSGLGVAIGDSSVPIVIAIFGLTTPWVTQFLVELEEWSPATKMRHNMWQMYCAKTSNAVLFTLLNLELTWDDPLLPGPSLPAQRYCASFRCAEDQVGASLLGLVMSELILSLLLKPIVNLFFAAIMHRVRQRKQKDVRFHWPEFNIAVFAVDMICFFDLISIVQRSVPYLALFAPIVLALHFKWLKFTLDRISSRPFVSESSQLDTTLHRILFVSTCMHFLYALIVLLKVAPHEPRCGPLDNHQSPGMMLLQLDLPFIGAVGGLAKWQTSNYVMVLGFCSILALLLFLRLAVSRSTNQKVLDQMADTSQRQIDALHRELWRLETQGDLLKRRILSCKVQLLFVFGSCVLVVSCG